MARRSLAERKRRITAGQFQSTRGGKPLTIKQTRGLFQAEDAYEAQKFSASYRADVAERVAERARQTQITQFNEQMDLRKKAISDANLAGGIKTLAGFAGTDKGGAFLKKTGNSLKDFVLNREQFGGFENKAAADKIFGVGGSGIGNEINVPIGDPIPQSYSNLSNIPTAEQNILGRSYDVASLNNVSGTGGDTFLNQGQGAQITGETPSFLDGSETAVAGGGGAGAGLQFGTNQLAGQSGTGLTTEALLQGGALEAGGGTVGQVGAQIGVGQTGAGFLSGLSTALPIAGLALGAFGIIKSIFGSDDEDTNDLGTVICTELHRQGYITDETLEAEREFGANLDVATYNGYRAFADPIVEKMKISPKFTKFVSKIALPIIDEINGKTSWWGRIGLKYGMKLCKYRGTRVEVSWQT